LAKYRRPYGGLLRTVTQGTARNVTIVAIYRIEVKMAKIWELNDTKHGYGP